MPNRGLKAAFYCGYCLHRRGRRWGPPYFYFHTALTSPYPGPSRSKEGLQSSRFPYFGLMACRYNLAKSSNTLPPPPGRESRRGRVTLPQNVSPWLRLPKVQNALEEGKKRKLGKGLSPSVCLSPEQPPCRHDADVRIP